jgi:hypothetical protein
MSGVESCVGRSSEPVMDNTNKLGGWAYLLFSLPILGKQARQELG